VNERTLERVLAELPAEAWDPPVPPPLVIPEPTPPARAPRLRRGWSPVPRPLAAAALAALLVALGFTGGALLTGGDRETGGAARVVELRPVPGAADTTGAGTVKVRARTVEVDVARLRPSRGGDFYELWLLTPPGELVSLGSFRVPPSGATSVRVPLPTDPRGYELFDVSIEPGDGDPRHSGRSVLRAPTS
jgi:hypothetical protein